MTIRQQLKEAKTNQYFPTIRKLLDRHNIVVKKWVKFEKDTGQVFHTDIEERRVLLPIPVCSESAYICLHEIGHVVKGDRKYVYLSEYHAEQYAMKWGEKMKLPQLAKHIKYAHKYVLDNLMEDVLFRQLDPNAVRREVRAWLGMSPTLIKKKALRRATRILREMGEVTRTDHSPISKVEINIVKQRKPILHEIITSDSED